MIDVIQDIQVQDNQNYNYNIAIQLWPTYINKSKVVRLDHIQCQVKLLRSVDHPDIMKLIDSLEDAKYLHIVTEWR